MTVSKLDNTKSRDFKSRPATGRVEATLLKITNGDFAPEFIRADPRIIEWANSVSEDTRIRILNSMDTKAKIDSENEYQTALAQYTISHETDLACVRENYQHELIKIQDEHKAKLKEAEEFYQKEYQEMIDNAKRNKPVITDPIARKKRHGSVSTINSPIVTKSQPFHMHANSNLDQEPTNAVTPANPSPPSQPLDPMTQILQKMSKQFDNFVERLDKLEATNKNTYTTSWDNDDQSWKQPENDLALAKMARCDDEYMANIDYDNAQLYDDPPNDHTFTYEEPYVPAQPSGPTDYFSNKTNETLPPLAQTITEPVSQDSDCVLLLGPPTPTSKKPAPSGLRPPERAQRIDFDSGKLASDSFGIPVGGLCRADGSISFSNDKPSCNNRPKKPLPIPENVTPYSPNQLVLFSKDVIIAHTLFTFQHHIPRKLTKSEVIKQYNIAIANFRKPGARQTTLSFASAASKPTVPTSRPKQTTPSAWSKSPSPPPRQTNQPRNNTIWVIRPRMRTQGLEVRPFEGNADKLTEWYQQRLQANAGPNKPALTLLHGAWAPSNKSIFSLTFAGHVTLQTVRAYTALFLEKFDNEHIFHPSNNTMKKIALFDIPIKRDNQGNPQSHHQLFDELSRGGSLSVSAAPRA